MPCSPLPGSTFIFPLQSSERLEMNELAKRGAFFNFPLLCWIIVGRDFPCPLPLSPTEQPPTWWHRTNSPCGHLPLPAPLPLFHCPIFRPLSFGFLMGEHWEWSNKSLAPAAAGGGMWWHRLGMCCALRWGTPAPWEDPSPCHCCVTTTSGYRQVLIQPTFPAAGQFFLMFTLHFLFLMSVLLCCSLQPPGPTLPTPLLCDTWALTCPADGSHIPPAIDRLS